MELVATMSLSTGSPICSRKGLELGLGLELGFGFGFGLGFGLALGLRYG